MKRTQSATTSGGKNENEDNKGQNIASTNSTSISQIVPQRVSTSTSKKHVVEAKQAEPSADTVRLADVEQTSFPESEQHVRIFSLVSDNEKAAKTGTEGSSASCNPRSIETTQTELKSNTVFRTEPTSSLTTTESSLGPTCDKTCRSTLDFAEHTASISSDINLTTNQRPSVLVQSVSKELKPSLEIKALPPENNDSSKLVCGESSRGDSRSITVIDIKRDTVVIGRKTEVPSAQPSNVGKSRVINYKQEQSYPSVSGDNPARPIGERDIITADIPQSLSTDSGIGSPLDARTGIDLSVGQGLELGKDGTRKVEICPVSSLATGVVPPNSDDRSENCRSCIYKGDDSSLSSRSDSSHYPGVLTKTGSQSLHTNAFSKHDSIPGNSPTINQIKNVDLDRRNFPDEKESNLKNVMQRTSHQNAAKQEEKFDSLQNENSGNCKSQTEEDEPAQRERLISEIKCDSHSSFFSNEKLSSVIRTIQTSEFTVEHDATLCASFRNKDTVNVPVLSSLRIDDTPLCKHIPDSPNTFTALQCVQTSDYVDSDVDIDKNGSNKENQDFTQVILRAPDSRPPGRKVKGILKTPSDPILGEIREGAEDIKIAEAKGEVTSPRSVSFNNTHTKNTFSYNNVAFEGEIITEPSKRASLAEVVSNMMRQSSVIDIDEDNSHPYGRDSSLTDLMTGKRRDSYNMDAGKMIVWLALAIMIVSLAGGIIFMSETYNLSHRDQGLMTMLNTDTTTPETVH